MLGVRGTIDRVLNANGPAQHLLCAGWGIVVAGMFHGSNVPDMILYLWAVLSVLIIVAVVWLPLATLQAFLLTDAVTSVVVLVIYLFVDHTIVHLVYDGVGNIDWEKSDYMVMTPVSEWSHVAAGAFMAAHGFYLANLVQRQRLELRRFSSDA